MTHRQAVAATAAKTIQDIPSAMKCGSDIKTGGIFHHKFPGSTDPSTRNIQKLIRK
jgi:hypothetical protein